MAEVSIVRRVEVHVDDGMGGEKPHPWSVHVDMVDGVEFVKLQKADRGFQRFLGAPLENLGVLDQLRHLRSQATMQSVVDSEANALFGDTRRKQKMRKVEAQAAQERGELPTMVTIAIPKTQDDEGNEIPPVACKVVANLDPRKPVSIELRNDVLLHLRLLVKSHDQKAGANQPASSANCRWMRDRNAFVAKRKENGKQVNRTFHPRENTEDAMIEARCKGLAWTRFEEVEDAPEDEGAAEDENAEQEEPQNMEEKA